MCSLCGGSVCANSGGCMVVINQAPEVIKISYSYTSNVVSAVTSYFVAAFGAIKNSLFSFTGHLRIKN